VILDAPVLVGPAEPATDLLTLELCDPEPSASAPPASHAGPAARPRSPEGPRPPHRPPADARPGSYPAGVSLFTPAPPGPPTDDSPRLPGSRGEHLLQCAHGTQDRARRFYADQVLDHLNPAMIEFVRRMEMLFVATADSRGECDASLRAGPPGFIEVLHAREIAYPEYRGNGVMASLGNISENPHVGLLMLDFVTDLIGLHINGKAHVVEDAELRRRYPAMRVDRERGRTPERWVTVHVEEAYIHCRKHIPRMVPVDRQRAWGSDDVRRKGGDYFDAKATEKPWAAPPATDREPAPKGVVAKT
jgi:uncharacterized protein